jgi:ABC-type uncharacterized transport system permease subunit
MYIALRTIAFTHPPITTIFEILTLIAFTVAVSYAYIELKTGNRQTGYFILILPFFFQFASSLFIRDLLEVDARLRSNLLGVHVGSALLGYAAITISGMYGLLYLMLYHDIKSSRFGVIYKRLPNLEILERMSFTATIFGFAFLSAAILIGVVWLPQQFQGFTYADPKLLSIVAIWLIYAVGLSAKKIAGWHGKRIVVLSLAGFIIALFSITFINMFFSGFHRFF